MKLQIAMDMEDINLYWKILDEVADLVDIIEIGGIGIFEGCKLIPATREKYPDKEILWDGKTTDFYNSIGPIDLGADYVSVCSDASDQCFKDHLEYAHKHGCKVVGDMYTETSGSNALMRLEKLGCDQISMHPNARMEAYPVGDVFNLKFAKDVVDHTEISAYGGFTVENCRPVLDLHPDIIVVGGAIFRAENPREATIAFLDLMKEYE